MADDMMTAAKGSVGALVAVGVPAFGGQVLSAILKAKSDMVRDATEGPIGEAAIDAASAIPFALAEIALAGALWGKQGMARATPLAVGGVLICGALPLVDRGIDRLVAGMFDDDDDKPATSGALPPKGMHQLDAEYSGGRVPAGAVGAIGETLPGGPVGDLGETLPGGRGNSEW
jgi:hypothetical protein